MPSKIREEERRENGEFRSVAVPFITIPEKILTYFLLASCQNLAKILMISYPAVHALLG